MQQAGLTTQVSYLGGVSVAERVGSSVVVEHVRGPDMGGGVGGMLYSLRPGSGSSEPRYSTSNGRGDVVAQSGPGGSLTWGASYEGYGKRTTEVGTNLDRQRANWLPKPVRSAASGL